MKLLNSLFKRYKPLSHEPVVKLIKPVVVKCKLSNLWCCDHPYYRPYISSGHRLAVFGVGATPVEAYENWKKRYDGGSQ